MATTSTIYQIPLLRLQQTLDHIQAPSHRKNTQKLAIVHGPSQPALWEMTVGELLTFQCLRYRNSECLVCPWTGARWTYGNLEDESNGVARGLIAKGIQHGDRVAVMAGNCEQYVSLFFAAARVGAILVVINNTYTHAELIFALKHIGCKLFFIVPKIGRHDLQEALKDLPSSGLSSKLPHLQQTIILRGKYENFETYEDVINSGNPVPMNVVQRRQDGLSPFDICNLQFTSGSTGAPKAAMLTHHNLINNSRFIGDRMDFTPSDVLCCPPPLFHCFGLVLGLLACITHGAKIVYPAETFDATLVLKAISDEKCTALHGVPTMFESILLQPRPEGFDCTYLRTGIIAGAPVPRPLMQRLLNELNMTEFTSSYGLTEASPTCFNALTSDSISRRLTTVGKVMPHASAKIINPRTGKTVKVGERGELCMAGYQIFQGYWNNPSKTAETLLRDDDGTMWLRTGDEAVFDEEGYCSITGRFKDIIIRGGENIYPLEIEERLAAHPSISKAAVVGIPDSHYGEVVGAFLSIEEGQTRPTVEELRDWTRKTLGRHKAPKHIFMLGLDPRLPPIMPLTGSGKVQKQVLRELGSNLLTKA
ncbi:SIN component scaffold protein Sid4 [Ophidiomyces ophidiicola]|nr:SIN component scaffold protein Sid4 [Ophidiomyces ophidiicola]KAI1907444.1 SIN component scaffold protein Sid4 [Ophidiomyces ophidiicola]KAI1907843.1 SIN component scaffold protein Sid4 [Ophidiomyces ophidiicola]KAI1922491.1 SIN component scaffold protein Sid4 [Ophidiomyces ophidiicola]KAI1937107.1 SIN component scaffold protein Sid4 [Ophidiomyces ophidiicola]KAI1938755.1 SIN component scaffold protein Sid4 [Ophidiomyces ophidiicola]